jgi:hypothetical protein
MSDAAVTEQELVAALRRVPIEHWPKILQWLRSLEPAPPNWTIRTAADMALSGIAGLWADRDDLGCSTEFVRSLRRRAEQRQGPSHAS